MRYSLRGAIFESYVVGELIKAFEHTRHEAPLYHWRDATGHEIDILVDLGDRLLPIEVKSGITMPSDALDGLRWWTRLPGNPNQTGVLVHGGEEARERGGFAILPWFRTWAALTESGHLGQAYEVTGPRRLARAACLAASSNIFRHSPASSQTPASTRSPAARRSRWGRDSSRVVRLQTAAAEG